MAVSYTTTYNLTKPEVGASEDQWGGLLNDNLDDLDNLLDGTTPVTGIDINSGTIDGITSLSTANGTDVSLAGASSTKFFWDASAESLGIGTTSPETFLHIAGTSIKYTNITMEQTDTSLATDQPVGQFLFKQNDASGAGTPAKFGAYAEGVSGQVGFRFSTGTGNTSTERMRIDASGNVGIGTNLPSTASHVKDGNGGLIQTIEAGDSNSAYTKYINSTTGSGAFTDGLLVGLDTDESATFWLYEADHMKFGTSGTERMRIDASGNLLVGKTVANTTTEGVFIDGPNGRLFVTADDDYTAQFTRNGSDGPLIYFYNDTAQAGLISISGTSTTYGTSSDYRLKTDVQPMAGASARVQALNPVNFEWIANGTRVDGFLAHEAQEVVPESVTGTKDAMRDEQYEVTPAVYEDVVIPAVLDEAGNELEAERTEQRLVSEAVMGTRSVPDYQGIDQSKLVPLLTAALQEALTEIADLKARVTALEA
jgi:hypothetical protein